MLIIRILIIVLCALAGPSFALESIPLPSFAQGALAGGLIVALEMLISQRISPRAISSVILGAFLGIAFGMLLLFLGITEYVTILAGGLSSGAVAKLVLTLCAYTGAAIVLRNRDRLHLILPFVNFFNYKEVVPSVVLDTSALIDGRIVTIAQSHFINARLIIPRFVVDELNHMSESEDHQKQIKGKKGLEVLSKLKNMNYVCVRIQELDLSESGDHSSRILYVASLFKAKLFTLDYNLAKLAEYQNIEWLNINALAKALSVELAVGQYLEIELVKKGKEDHQGVGYLPDGSMVVVNEGGSFIGRGKVTAQVINIIPSAGGKMVFTKFHKAPDEANALV